MPNSPNSTVIWYTGLPGSGKTTLAKSLSSKLTAQGQPSVILDGDNIRKGLSRDLGFSDEDRAENIRRVAEVAKLMAEVDLTVIVAMISPFQAERQMAREILRGIRFVETHINAPLPVCESRDPKGMYKLARQGKIRNFTGIDSHYEPPENPELRVDTVNLSVEESTEFIVAYLKRIALANEVA